MVRCSLARKKNEPKHSSSSRTVSNSWRNKKLLFQIRGEIKNCCFQRLRYIFVRCATGNQVSGLEVFKRRHDQCMPLSNVWISSYFREMSGCSLGELRLSLSRLVEFNQYLRFIFLWTDYQRLLIERRPDIIYIEERIRDFSMIFLGILCETIIVFVAYSSVASLASPRTDLCQWSDFYCQFAWQSCSIHLKYFMLYRDSQYGVATPNGGDWQFLGGRSRVLGSLGSSSMLKDHIWINIVRISHVQHGYGKNCTIVMTFSFFIFMIHVKGCKMSANLKFWKISSEYKLWEDKLWELLL